MKSLAYALIILGALAANMISDLLIRAGGIDGKDGITASSWDVLTVFACYLLWRDRA